MELCSTSDPEVPPSLEEVVGTAIRRYHAKYGDEDFPPLPSPRGRRVGGATPTPTPASAPTPGTAAVTAATVVAKGAPPRKGGVSEAQKLRKKEKRRVKRREEAIEIRTYSVIYDAIDEVKEAMEGMLSPEIKEKIVGNVEIRETFKISKVGTIAGCMVTSGKINRNSKIRIIRNGIVQYTGELESLKRFKDDVKEVTKGYECGLNVKDYNNIEIGDILEVYEEFAVKRKL